MDSSEMVAMVRAATPVTRREAAQKGGLFVQVENAASAATGGAQ
jgi:hypothetical protein